MKRTPNPYPRKIRNRLILAFLIPTMIIVTVSGAYFFVLAEKALEEEMGLRLRSLAGSGVESISGEAVLSFVPGDEQGRAYNNSRERLRRLMSQGDAARIYVFDKGRKSLLDTRKNVPIGFEYVRLDADQFEIDQVLEDGVTVSTTLFQGEDGKLYKTGYAPLMVEDEVVAVLGVDADVRFFKMMTRVRNNLIVFGVIGILAVIVIGVIMARSIEKPIAKLVEDARKIGKGELEHEIISTTKDEIGFLAFRLNQMRQSILERDRHLNVLQRGIAHEVRNPLGGMELYCDILLEELGSDEDKKLHVKKIRREVATLNKVVDDFLDFTKEVVPDVRSVNIEDFIQEVLIHYSAILDGQDIKIEKTFPEEITHAVFDPDLIRRALFNLINNAVQSMGDSGVLKIEIVAEDDLLSFQIKDTGRGIPLDDIESVFTPFFTTKNKGTGLGLPLAKKIAQYHGGELMIESQPGQGTVVSLSIPLRRNE